MKESNDQEQTRLELRAARLGDVEFRAYLKDPKSYDEGLMWTICSARLVGAAVDIAETTNDTTLFDVLEDIARDLGKCHA